MHFTTEKYLYIVFACKIGDFKIVGDICLQKITYLSN